MARRLRRNNRPQVPFAYKLVLNQWLFSLFGLPSSDGFHTWNGKRLPLMEALRQKFQLSDDTIEGLDEHNIHRFHTALVNKTEELAELPNYLLLEYDQNIVRHTQRINEWRLARGEDAIVWKYFQYLMLLFTEVYLDRYFHAPAALLASINEQIARYNEDKPDPDKVPPFDANGDVRGQLNKLAFWSATGSGKTLIMHANILQYQHYIEKHGLPTGSEPHHPTNAQRGSEHPAPGGIFRRRVFRPSCSTRTALGFLLVAPSRSSTSTSSGMRWATKPSPSTPLKATNLVLIDEGHRGASAGETGSWMRFRNQLCDKGFSFEYSATFGQAVKGRAELTAQYAGCILFDYSYKYFYGDGFGKDYQILNLDPETQENYLELYLTACLLAFFQQQRLYSENEATCRPFNLEKPLWNLRRQQGDGYPGPQGRFRHR